MWGVKRVGDIYSGGERPGDEFEILADSVRVFNVALYRENCRIDIISKRYQSGKGHFQALGRCLWYVLSVIWVRSLYLWKDVSENP